MGGREVDDCSSHIIVSRHLASYRQLTCSPSLFVCQVQTLDLPPCQRSKVAFLRSLTAKRRLTNQYDGRFHFAFNRAPEKTPGPSTRDDAAKGETSLHRIKGCSVCLCRVWLRLRKFASSPLVEPRSSTALVGCDHAVMQQSLRWLALLGCDHDQSAIVLPALRSHANTKTHLHRDGGPSSIVDRLGHGSAGSRCVEVERRGSSYCVS